MMGDDGCQSDEAVTLIWTDHSALLTEGIWKSLVGKSNVDVKLCCGVNSPSPAVEAHRLVLSVLCPKLNLNVKRELVTGGVVHSLDVPEAGPTSLDVLLEFLYRGRVTLARGRLELLRKCAQALRAERIVEIIDEYTCKSMQNNNCRVKLEEENVDLNQIARRKRKSTPVKLQKDVLQVEQSVVQDDDQRSKREKVESQVFDVESMDDEDDLEAGKVEVKSSKRGPKPNKNSSAATRNRTAYKRTWRLNQPLQKCPHCSYETRDKESYRSHANKHDPAAERYVCRYCEKTFRSKRGFVRHQNIHLQPDRIHRCPLCPYLTPLRSTMVQHMGTVHRADLEGKPLTGKFKCPDCDFSCLFECQLKIHLIRKHKKERPFKCAECEYSAVLKADLDKHISIRHRFERPYMCEICGFRSQSQGGYNRHKRSHTGEKPFSCSVCEKQYADSRKFKIHVRRHEKDEKPFTCHLCGHACRRKDNLKMHLKRIHKTEIEGDPMMAVPCSMEEDTEQETNLVLSSGGIGCDTLTLRTADDSRRHQTTARAVPTTSPPQSSSSSAPNSIPSATANNQSEKMTDTVVLYF